MKTELQVDFACQPPCLATLQSYDGSEKITFATSHCIYDLCSVAVVLCLPVVCFATGMQQVEWRRWQ